MYGVLYIAAACGFGFAENKIVFIKLSCV